MLIIGTPNFVSEVAATIYYGSKSVVERKLLEGEIYIGKPELKQGERLILLDEGLRYGIERKASH